MPATRECRNEMTAPLLYERAIARFVVQEGRPHEIFKSSHS
jgi:hypothetical protein